MLGLRNLVTRQFIQQKTLINIQQFQFARKSKHGYNFKVDKDPINVKDVQYPFDAANEGIEYPEKPQMYVKTLKKREAESLKKKEFILYQQKMRNLANQELENQKQEQQKSQQKEFLWDNGLPPKRPYDKVENKELTYIYRDEKYFERADKMIDHLVHFQQPYTIHDQQIRDIIDQIKQLAGPQNIKNQSVTFIIEEFYQQNDQIKQLFTQLNTLIQQANYKLLPQIGLALSFELRYKIDFAKVWQSYVQVLEKNLHHFTPLEIAQIKHALHATYPKIGAPHIHKAFIDILIPELPLCTVQELFHLFHAFRNLKSDKIQTRILNEILSKKNEIQDVNDYAHIVYTYAACRLKKQNRKKYREENEELKEAQKVLEIVLQDLNNHILEMKPESAVKLATAMCILRLPNQYIDVISRIEKNLIQNAGKLDSTMVAQVLYAFSKMGNNMPQGSQEFYQGLAPVVEKQFNDFTNMEKAKILYAYTVRKQISEAQFTKMYLPWISKEMPNFCYTELHYISYILMFHNVTDKNIWKKFVHNISYQQFNCPVSHYLPIKFARYYLDGLFPEWNFEPMEDACRAAEFSFNTLRIKNTHLDTSMMQFGQILRNKLQIDAKFLVEFDNLLIVDFAILPEKVAILYQNERFSQFDNPELSLPIFDLRAQILQNNGWGVLKVSQEEFASKGLEKIDWLKEQFENVYKQQAQAYKDQEMVRFAQTLHDMDAMGEKATLQSEAHKERGLNVEIQQ